MSRAEPLDVRVFVTGPLTPDLQVDRLLAAFGRVRNRIPRWQMLVVGTDGTDGTAAVRLQRQVRRLGLADRVEHRPAVGLDDALAAGGVYVTAALTGDVADLARRAHAGGRPVIGFDAPTGLRDVVEHDVSGLLVAPGSEAGLASALLRIADDDLRTRLSAGARAAAAAPPPPEPQVTYHGSSRLVHTTPPWQARAQILDHLVRIVASATPRWIVAPAHDAPPPLMIVPMADRPAVTAALAAADWPDWVEVRHSARHGWPDDEALPGPWMTEGRTASLTFECNDRAAGTAGTRVELQFWEQGPGGALAAPFPNGRATRLTTAAIEQAVPGVVDGVEVRSLPTLLARPATAVGFPVDVVYTWVDGGDPAWARARAKRLKRLPEQARRKDASGAARFTDRGELRFSLRSVHDFAPWVRTIHLVTAGQVPDWLDAAHPRINLVDHREILPKDALPTFNSHAIETALHRIPGLSEHFVYLNDDVFLGRPLGPEAFFTPGGLNRFFLDALPAEVDEGLDVPIYLRAAWNNRALLQRRFDAVPLLTLAHTPHAHRVSELEALHVAFGEALDLTARSPFRGPEDVSTLSSLAQFWGLLRGTAVVGEAEALFINIAQADVDDRLESAGTTPHDFLCLGDHHEHALAEDELAELLDDFLYDTYPAPAPWEKP